MWPILLNNVAMMLKLVTMKQGGKPVLGSGNLEWPHFASRVLKESQNVVHFNTSKQSHNSTASIRESVDPETNLYSFFKPECPYLIFTTYYKDPGTILVEEPFPRVLYSRDILPANFSELECGVLPTLESFLPLLSQSSPITPMLWRWLSESWFGWPVDRMSVVVG